MGWWCLRLRNCYKLALIDRSVCEEGEDYSEIGIDVGLLLAVLRNIFSVDLSNLAQQY